MDNIEGLVKTHQWSDLLGSLPANRMTVIQMDGVKSLDSLRSVAGRINARGTSKRRYKVKIDYPKQLAVVTVSLEKN